MPPTSSWPCSIASPYPVTPRPRRLPTRSPGTETTPTPLPRAPPDRLQRSSVMSTKTSLALSGHPEADELLAKDPLALLIGMVLDQQIPLEWAFLGPFTLTQRLGHNLDA